MKASQFSATDVNGYLPFDIRFRNAHKFLIVGFGLATLTDVFLLTFLVE